MHHKYLGKKRSDTGIRGKKKNYIDLILLFLIVQHLPEIKPFSPPDVRIKYQQEANWLKSARVMLPDLGASGAQQF